MMLFVVRERRAGFTLIEVMIVIAIIAILAGIVVPNIASARQEAWYRSCAENCRTYGNVIAMYIARHSEKELYDKMPGGGVGGRSVWGYDTAAVSVGARLVDEEIFIPEGYLQKSLICQTRVFNWPLPLEGTGYTIGYGYYKLHKSDSEYSKCWVVYGTLDHELNGVSRRPLYAVGYGLTDYYD